MIDDTLLPRCEARIKSKRDAARILEEAVKHGDIQHPILRERWIDRAAVFRSEANDLEDLVAEVRRGR